MKHRSRILASSLFVLALLLPCAASADAEQQDVKRQQWVERYQELKQRHARLEKDLAQTRVDYSRGRSTKHLRGEGKAGLLKDLKRLEEEFAAADQELEDFPDMARRDGAYPGWFRDIEAPEASQPPAYLQDDEAEPTQSRAEKRAAERKRRRPGRD